MDKTWINLKETSSPYYIEGVLNFVNFTFEKSAKAGKILCPCRRCANLIWCTKEEVVDHLVEKGFLRNYNWTSHEKDSAMVNSSENQNEEEIAFNHDMRGLLQDAFLGVNMDDSIHNEGVESFNSGSAFNQEPSMSGNHMDGFFNLLKDAGQKLYPNCEESKLAAVVHLFHLKCLNGWSNKSFTQLLEYLIFLLPEGNLLPKSYSGTKKIIRSLGLSYEKIHACPNDCMLFWKDKVNDDFCSECGASRWIVNTNIEEDSIDCTIKKKKPKAAKILRWFPLIPRLQRLYMSSKTAALMRCHDEERTKDGLIRHPTDSIAWKHLDEKYPEFAADPRNLRLGLASDGFNPFKSMNVTYSTWPVILMPYNLPPWLCMKQPNLILSLLIPGPKSPGNKIDIYMQPLIEELQQLWDTGIETFDASKRERFQLRAALLWTINDSPARAILSGWSTRGEKACPCCGYNTESKWLYHSRKYCYMGHRRWLDRRHRYRHDGKSFDGNKELRMPPSRTSGSEILSHADNVNIMEGESSQPLKKISIFFTLPYWQHNLLPHNIDMMHTEKNVFDNTYGTITDQDGKTKDNYKARCDLQDMGLRADLHPKPGSIKQRKIIGLKSYDGHILMEELLPVAIRGSLPKRVASVIVELCQLFKCLCAKVFKESDLDELKSQSVIILCEMEKIFPPSFFTVMVHLVMHLAEEVKLGGPVAYRFLLTLKNYVCNRAHPEGSIAEAYLSNECLTFCSRYLEGVETRFNRPLRNNDEDDREHSNEVEENLITLIGRPLGRAQVHMVVNLKKRKRVRRIKLDSQPLLQAHRYILFNTHEVTPFIEEHKDFLKKQHRSPRLSQYEIERRHSLTFHEWFRDRVARMEQQGYVISEKFKWLSKGPSDVALTYSGYLCDWANTQRGCKKDEFGFTLVNFNHLSHTGSNPSDDPYIFASQASKVFYIEDAREKGWQVVKHVKVRGAFDLGEVIPIRAYEVAGTDMASTWVRRDTEEEGIIVTPNMEVETYDEEEMDD
ncbi:hypothetical protein SLEP1_g58932 [Rubroshorea leprosula]|uniref:Transposase n=1 Tax=Rubroshorea leprosula TaxID=152421 RepID=A0AAV5MTN6_9ROSI|nr:hypothetical protein SLEP1_g58932 [Rubroshorea leprosula]